MNRCLLINNPYLDENRLILSAEMKLEEEAVNLMAISEDKYQFNKWLAMTYI